MSIKHKSLLIIAHTPSPNTRVMAEALLEGASNEVVEDVAVTLVSPLNCSSEMILQSDGLILFTTENFGYMSGLLKDMFERIYYPCLDDPKRNNAKPFALVIKAGLDGTGSEIAISKIVKGLNWRQVQETTLCKGDFKQSFVDRCRHLGLTIAASVDAELI